MAEGVGVVVRGTPVGAEADFGGGGGRLVFGGTTTGTFRGCWCCFSELDFFSQLVSEDCMVGWRERGECGY